MLRKKEQKLKHPCLFPFFSGSVSFPYSPILYFPGSGKWQWNLSSSAVLSSFSPAPTWVFHSFFQTTCAAEGFPHVSSLKGTPTSFGVGLSTGCRWRPPISQTSLVCLPVVHRSCRGICAAMSAASPLLTSMTLVSAV